MTKYNFSADMTAKEIRSLTTHDSAESALMDRLRRIATVMTDYTLNLDGIVFTHRADGSVLAECTASKK